MALLIREPFGDSTLLILICFDITA